MMGLLQPRISGNVCTHHSCKTLHASLLLMEIYVDDGHLKLFHASLGVMMDNQYVIFYSLLADSTL